MKIRWQPAVSILASVLVFCTQTFSCAPARAERIDPDRFASSVALSPKAREAAVLLGILPKVERLLQMKQSQPAGVMSDEELALKVDVLDRVLGASLEVRMVAGRIDRELAWAYAGHDMLQSKQQRNLNYLFTANFMQGGILGVLSGPAFLDGEPKTGTELLLLASSIGLGLSTLALLQSKIPMRKRMDGGTTVLANVFHLPQQAPPEHQTDIITRYLNSAPPGAAGGKTRIESLMDGWKKGHYLTSMKQTNLERLAAMEPAGKKYKESARLLDNRIRMLYDVQYTVEMLHEELLELLRTTEMGW